MPLLAALLFGIVDFGMVINRDTLVNNAAREGAREGSVNPDEAAIEDVVNSVLSNTNGNVTVASSCTKADSSTCTLHDTGPLLDVEGNVSSGDRVIVTVTYDHTWITFVPRSVGMGETTALSKTIEMRVE